MVGEDQAGIRASDQIDAAGKGVQDLLEEQLMLCCAVLRGLQELEAAHSFGHITIDLQNRQ